MRDLPTTSMSTSSDLVASGAVPPSRSDGSLPRVDREGAWSAPGTRTRSSWGTGAERPEGSVFRCLLRGELDSSCREELLQVARDFAASRSCRAQVDVSEVTFVDSSALALLLSMRRTAVERGGEVVLVAPGRQLQRLLSLAGVTDLFDVRGTGV